MGCFLPGFRTSMALIGPVMGEYIKQGTLDSTEIDDTMQNFVHLFFHNRLFNQFLNYQWQQHQSKLVQKMADRNCCCRTRNAQSGSTAGGRSRRKYDRTSWASCHRTCTARVRLQHHCRQRFHHPARWPSHTCASSNDAGCTDAASTIGTNAHGPTRYGPAIPLDMPMPEAPRIPVQATPNQEPLISQEEQDALLDELS